MGRQDLEDLMPENYTEPGPTGRAGAGVKVRLQLTDLADNLASHIGNINLNFGNKPGGNKKNGGGHGTSGPDAGLGILFQEMIHYGIAYLIADFMRMSISY